MMKAAGGSAVTDKDILNVAQTYGREHAGGKADDAAQLMDLITLLLQKYWFVAELKADGGHGVTFAHMDGIQGLRRRGRLMLIQSAKNMNHLDWRLTSFIIRDEYGTWIPAVFFLQHLEDIDLTDMVFEQVKTWCGDKWPLRYIVSDGTMGWQDAANRIFRGEGA